MKTQVIFVFLFSVLFNSHADNDENFYFRHYTNKDGLSNNTVYCSLQDKKGFMWFGTDEGLNRFDGYAFQNFRYNAKVNTGETLLNDHVFSIYEDFSGKIWICTRNGVCYYDYESGSGSFRSFIPDPQLSSYYADQICEDKNGNIWMRNSFHLLRYNAKDQSSKIFPSDKYKFTPLTMTITENGDPVFADTSSLFIYNPEAENFIQLLTIRDFVNNDLNTISFIKEIPQVGFLIGTKSEGLLMYHSGRRLLETVIPEIQVRSIMQYNTNVYWIASESGIYIYNLIDKSVVNLRKSLTNNYAIADNAVYTLTKDREGGIWVGTYFGGINYLPRSYKNFTYYIGGKTHTGMLGNTIREIHPDQYGNLWLGTEDNGVNCFNLKTNKMVNYSLLNEERKLAATNIHGLYPDGDTLWIGSFNKGIELMHIPTRKILRHFTQSNTNNQLASDFVLCFYRTRNDEFLVGTFAGVFLFDKKTNTFSKWKGVENLARQILEDHEGNIWVSTDNGLYKYVPPKSDTEEDVPAYRYVKSPESQKPGLGSSNTTSVFEDSKGRIWITTVYGFSLYDKNTDSFNRITTDDGLPSNMIYRIVEDEDGIFWISTANGLVRFNPETYVMHTYTGSDGLHETQFNYSSSYKDPSGTIYMGTVRGMISFNPRQFINDSYSPELHITRIQTHDTSQNHLLQPVSDKPYTLKLPYNSSTFIISYIAPAYTSPDAVKYSYLLDGVDKDWIYMDKNKEVTFANLAPGKYIFRVRSTNINDVWQDNEQILHIVITPPFWATIGAFIFYGFVIVTSIVFFYKYKKRKLFMKVQRNQELFEVEKDKELYNAKIQFFTFITHEIRTPLTLIKAPLEKIIKSDDGTEVTKHNLQIIEKNTQRLLDLSNQLLDFRKTESHGFRLNFVKTDITAMMENILVPFIPVFQNENKHTHIEISDNHIFAYIDRNAFTKIITNLLTNALKYSTNYIALKLSVTNGTEQTFQVAVVNNGFLVPEKERENIFTPFYRLKENENMQGSGIGLSLSRTLAEFHHGSLVFQETPEGFNQFMLTLPIVQEDYNFDLTQKNVAQSTEIMIPVTSGKQIILIVEDQPDMRKFLSGELSLEYEILEAENGREALDILSKNNVSLIVSDIMMPVMDGFELCNTVKNDVQYSHIPLILLTAQHNQQSRLTGLNEGADAYMEKPFSLEHLFAQIGNLLKNRELLRQSYLEKPLTPASSLAVSLVDNQFIQKLNASIEENLANENLSVEMIAGKMNMSASSLYRKVKGLSDLSPVDFIRMARLKKAVQLMQDGEKRINEIAFLVGFSSPAYFSTCFQKQYGKSPSEFIKEMG
ncbi:MAG: response regulator [Tannerella sp.]|jgi:ligand-binding sensor domain-containing protein/signal transduction histidine kinase/DNA-binding response OmpR family regulator|nr:response regulator [Tannerella sp.]